ncbi:hypothetical protein THAOC_07441 [Thalassiosira oceanica]|uniref:Uncharacterized protein n=1 Tax=Thalassiosira oceanica TaxID=159749 RepID=K0T1W8_THAOC|nr:hypothetical protein THAOC_07441 [Thalassiosira oceanica]|eukprot:EJK71149.1 hypothetical protein THAOC_07441 [Thalassiosira oceanica]
MSQLTDLRVTRSWKDCEGEGASGQEARGSRCFFADRGSSLLSPSPFIDRFDADRRNNSRIIMKRRFSWNNNSSFCCASYVCPSCEHPLSFH